MLSHYRHSKHRFPLASTSFWKGLAKRGHESHRSRSNDGQSLFIYLFFFYLFYFFTTMNTRRKITSLNAACRTGIWHLFLIRGLSIPKHAQFGLSECLLNKIQCSFTRFRLNIKNVVKFTIFVLLIIRHSRTMVMIESLTTRYIYIYILLSVSST